MAGRVATDLAVGLGGMAEGGLGGRDSVGFADAEERGTVDVAGLSAFLMMLATLSFARGVQRLVE